MVHWNTLALALGVLTEGVVWDSLTIHVLTQLVTLLSFPPVTW